MKLVQVTIDGPCGAGKSTVARKIANKLGFVHLDSGALYRAVGLKAIEQGISLDAEHLVAKVAREQKFRFELDEQGFTRLIMNNRPVGDEIRSEKVGSYASKVAVLPEVRAVLTEVQRAAAVSSSVVLEGRDAGTVVFPNAEFKFFLDASVQERARRRLLEMQSKGIAESANLTLETVQREIEERDLRDSTRSAAPAVKAEDAMLVDTTGLTIEQVIDKLAKQIAGRANA